MHRLARATTTVFTPLRYAKTYVVARALATLATNIAHWQKNELLQYNNYYTCPPPSQVMIVPQLL